MKFSEKQKEVIRTEGNLVVSASAGAGKTATMVEKIAVEIEKIRDHKVFGAITFTIKAANEIRERIKVDVSNHFIGTNNSFAIDEVIRPFLKDLYGDEFNIDISTDYSLRFEDIHEGIKKILETGNIGSFNNNKKNFVFRLAMEIVSQSKACKLYLKAKYKKLYIDEYQDCDKDMHRFFMFLNSSLGIELFVVGDDKQSIYMWRGAYPKAFKSLWNNPDFKHLKLYENYRSCKQIQNYSNILVTETRSLFENMDIEGHVKLLSCRNENDIRDLIIANFDVNKRCAILRYSRDNSRKYARLLQDKGYDFKYIPQPPIGDITTKSSWLYGCIAKYCILKKYSVYNFVDSIPSETEESTQKVNRLKQYLEAICLCKDNFDQLYIEVNKLGELFGYDIKKTHVEKLYRTIKNVEFHYSFEVEKYRNVVLTFHSSKGLEFDQVAIFAEDYNLGNEESVYNHYVASTRAKEKLLIIYKNNKAYKNNLKRILDESNLSFQDIFQVEKKE